MQNIRGYTKMLNYASIQELRVIYILPVCLERTLTVLYIKRFECVFSSHQI